MDAVMTSCALDREGDAHDGTVTSEPARAEKSNEQPKPEPKKWSLKQRYLGEDGSRGGIEATFDGQGIPYGPKGDAIRAKNSKSRGRLHQST